MRRASLLFAGIVTCAAGHAQGPPVVPLGQIEVVGVAPLPGLGTPVEQVPSNVQSFGASELARQRTGGVAEFLNFNANSTSLGSPTATPTNPM
jgi:outer membrane receptor protein involved in Fe transport